MRKAALLLPLMALLSACGAIPQSRQHQSLAQSTQSFSPAPDEGQCLATLGQKQAAFTPLRDEYYGAGCATINTVRLLSLRADDTQLSLTNMGPVACPLANRFAGWARFGVDRAARQILGSPLVRIETMGSYACRNVAGTDHRSAHATGKAIDVSGFDLADGRRITVLGDWYAGTPQERQFLKVIHQSACKRFGTVLGPDYNPAHHNHFHVELSPGAFCH